METACGQELEAAGHIASTTRKLEAISTGAQLAFSFFIQSGIPTRRTILSTVRVFSQLN